MIESFRPHGTTLLELDTGMVAEQHRIDVMRKAVNMGFLPHATENQAYDVPNDPLKIGFGYTPRPGDDVLIGGAGADKLYGGAGSDTASYETSVIGLLADMTTPSANTNDAKGDAYHSIENLVGTNFDDHLGGNAVANIINGAGGNDILHGRDGGDSLIGGVGADLLDGGKGNDVLVVDNVGDKLIEGANEGSDTVVASISFMLGANIETLGCLAAAISMPLATIRLTSWWAMRATTYWVAVVAKIHFKVVRVQTSSYSTRC